MHRSISGLLSSSSFTFGKGAVVPQQQQVVQRRFFLRATGAARGMDQLTDIPNSSTRIPKGRHSGPLQKQLNTGETMLYQFVKKWDLTMQDQWDELEAFKGMPKPKRQFGNEACEIIWPYALLLERPLHVHRFTKSIYVYYPQRQLSADGAFSAKVAQRFSREFLIPITFHNSQTYVETEMLLEYGEVPWVVIHCLDGRHAVIPVRFTAPTTTTTTAPSPSTPAAASESGITSPALPTTAAATAFNPAALREGAEALLEAVIAQTEALGEGVKDMATTLTALHERPPQNQYVRVNYQWFGDTMEERSQHQVRWDWTAKDITPATRYKDADVLKRLNFDGRLPTMLSMKQEVSRMRKHGSPRGDPSGRRSFLSGQASRQNARFSRFGSNN